MEVIGVIVAGIIIGLLGKFVAPGSRDNTPLWLTILCGIGGVLIGWFIYTAVGGDGSSAVVDGAVRYTWREFRDRPAMTASTTRRFPLNVDVPFTRPFRAG